MSEVVIFLNLVLIFLYLYLFGWTSFINYLEGGIIIKRNSAFVRPKDIKQPGSQDRPRLTSLHLSISGIMIKSVGDNFLPRKLIPKLQLTCRGRRETELKICIENVLLAFDNVVLNTSHQVQHETVLIQYGLGKLANIMYSSGISIWWYMNESMTA